MNINFTKKEKSYWEIKKMMKWEDAVAQWNAYREDFPLHQIDCRKIFSCGQDLSGINLSNMLLSRQNLKGINFAGADMTNAHLENCNLVGCDFRGAILRSVKFNGADLRESNFTGAVLNGAVFNKKTKLAGAIFVGSSGLEKSVYKQAWIETAKTIQFSGK